MIGDSKNIIGQQIANLGPINNQQIDLYRKQLISVQLPDNNDRIIDMLNMELFGHNPSILRQSLSIVEANHVNSDREYGVLQCEDEFKFVPTSYISIDDDATAISDPCAGWIINYPAQNVSGKSVSIVKETLVNTNTINNSPAYAIPFVRFVERVGSEDSPTSGKFHNVQHIHCHDGTTKHNFNDGASHDMIDTPSGATLNQDCTLPSQVYGDRRDIGYQIVECELNITNYSDSIIQASMKCFEPNGDTGWKDVAPGANKSFSTGSANNSKLRGLGIMFKYNGVMFPVDIQGYATLIRTLTFSIKTGTSTMRVANAQSMYKHVGSYWHWNTEPWTNLSISVPSSYVYPKCDILFRVRDSSGWHESFIRLTNEVYQSSKYNVVVGSINKQSIRDLSYYNYFLGAKALNSTIKYSSRLIASQAGGSDSFDAILTIPESMQEYVLKPNALVNRSTMSKFHTLINIIDGLDIGLIERLDASMQFGIMFNGVCYSARSDRPISKQYFKLYKFKILTIGNDKVSFLVECNVEDSPSITHVIKKKLLFNFHSYFDYDGGMLVEDYRNIYDFYAIDCSDGINNGVATIGFNPVPGDLSLVLNTYSISDVMYYSGLSTIRVSAIKTGSTMCLHGNLMLNSTLSELVGLTKYVVRNTSIPFPTGYNVHIEQTNIMAKTSVVGLYVAGPIMTMIIRIPATSAEIKEFNTLPLRMLDEYPSIFNKYNVGDSNLVLGKSKFVSSNGDLYQASEFSLVCNSDSPLLIGNGNVFSDGGRVYIANNNLTEIYSYSEFGFNKLLVLEDTMLCNPVSSSSGVMMCCTKGIYSMSQEYGVRKIWSSSSKIESASLRTVLDNCCIAVVNDSSRSNIQLVDGDGKSLIDGDGLSIINSNIIFTAIIINQNGYVSSQLISSDDELLSSEFIDTGSSSDLIMIDLYGVQPITKLDKIAIPSDAVYSISSNQHIEQYGSENIKGLINTVSFFAKGTGTITISINDIVIGSVSISNVDKYKRYSINISNTSMDMINYKIVASKDVKLLQKVLGTVNMRKVRYGN